jgi:hypothetical protein
MTGIALPVTCRRVPNGAFLCSPVPDRAARCKAAMSIDRHRSPVRAVGDLWPTAVKTANVLGWQPSNRRAGSRTQGFQTRRRVPTRGKVEGLVQFPVSLPATGQPVDLLWGWYASPALCYAVGMQACQFVMRLVCKIGRVWARGRITNPCSSPGPLRLATLTQRRAI